MTTGSDFGSFFGDVFETDPLGQRALFESFAPPSLNPLQQSQFSSLFTPTLNRYLGILGSQVRAGGQPSQTLTDYLTEQDFGRQFRRFTPPSQSGLVSPTRFFFNVR